MIVFDLWKLENLRDAGRLPEFVSVQSRPSQNPDDSFETRWRLAYISAHQPIAVATTDHLVSLQFLMRKTNVEESLRVYFASTSGEVDSETNSEKKMSHGHLLKKKVHDNLNFHNNQVIPKKQRIVKKICAAVYFRIR